MTTLPQRLAHGSFWLSHATFWFTFLLGMYLGNSPVCVPYLTGCTSITATGVPDPQAFFFRGGLIAACVLFVFWWYSMQAWLTQLAPGRQINTVKYMTMIGIFSSICLIISTAVMRPERGELPWRTHTIAAALFFLISLLVQTRVTLYLRQLQKQGIDIGSSLPFKTKLIIAQWGFLFFMLYLQIFDGTKAWKNVVEWWMALLIGLYYLSSARDWGKFKLTDNE